MVMFGQCSLPGLDGKREVVVKQQHCVARQQGALGRWRRGGSVGRGHGKWLKESSRGLRKSGWSKSVCAAAGGTEGSVHLSTTVGEQGSGAAGANGVPSVVIPLNYAQVCSLLIE